MADHERSDVSKDRRIGSLREELAKRDAELATLRLIVTEKFAGADLYVKPEDAADVAKWAANAQHVRELLKHEPTIASYEGEPDAVDHQCESCGVFNGGPHRTVAFREGIATPCRVATAWRALGDPRGAEDIERAHEEALREHRDRLPYTARHMSDLNRQQVLDHYTLSTFHETGGRVGEWVDASRGNPFVRLAEEQVAAQRRVLNLAGVEIGVPGDARPPQGFSLMPPREPFGIPYVAPDAAVRSRFTSDARGMEAVEAEARALHSIRLDHLLSIEAVTC